MTCGTGTYSIFYAESLDGRNFTVNPVAVISTNNSHPGQIIIGGVQYVYVVNQTSAAIDEYASSAIGPPYTLANAGVLTKGGAGAWDHSILFNPSPFLDASGTEHLPYEATLSPALNSIGDSVCSAPGTCAKYIGNPIITNSAGMIGHPNFNLLGSTYYLWVHGSVNAALSPTDGYYLGSSSSIYGPWPATLSGITPVFPRLTVDEGVGNSTGQIGDVHIFPFGNKVFAYYTAVDGAGVSTIKADVYSGSLATLVAASQGTISQPGDDMPPQAQIYCSASYSVANGGGHVLSGCANAAGYDFGDMWTGAASTHPAWLYIQKTGSYSVDAFVQFASNAIGDRQVQIWANTCNCVIADSGQQPATIDGNSSSVHAFNPNIRLVAGDSLYEQVGQWSSGSLNVLYAAGVSPYFTVRWTGP
jgi:hypothetical protein